MIPNPRHFGRIGKASIEELKEQIILNKLRYIVSPCCPISEKLTYEWMDQADNATLPPVSGN